MYIEREEYLNMCYECRQNVSSVNNIQFKTFKLSFCDKCFTNIAAAIRNYEYNPPIEFCEMLKKIKKGVTYKIVEYKEDEPPCEEVTMDDKGNLLMLGVVSNLEWTNVFGWDENLLNSKWKKVNE